MTAILLLVIWSNDNRLVLRHFTRPLKKIPQQSLCFSDRGFQYTNKHFQKKLNDNDMVQSMSRAGHCIDNGAVEGFWGIIKSEMYQMYEIR